MLTFARSLLLVVAALWLQALAAQTAPERVALVIGNSSYQAVPLPNPRNDAKAMGDLLKRAGFAVDQRIDTSQADLKDAIERFGRTIRDPKVKFGLFYYAGHGLQLEWRNYLVPVSADIRTADDVKRQTVDVSELLAYMEQAKGRSFLVILDACRDDPFAGSYRPQAKGLSQFDAPVGSLLAYATAPGNVALDGEGENGLYTSSLLQEFAAPGVRLEDAFKRVRLTVRLASKGKQIPWESTSLEEDVYLFPTSKRKLSEAEQEQQLEQELQAWVRVKSSNNIEQLAGFLREHPSGYVSELAQSRLSRLLAQQGQQQQAADAERRAREDAARQAEVAERRAREEAERLAQAERERQARDEEARRLADAARLQREAETRRLAEAERLAREQAQRQAEAAEQARQAARRQALEQAEAAERARRASELLAQAEAAERARAEAQRAVEVARLAREEEQRRGAQAEEQAREAQARRQAQAEAAEHARQAALQQAEAARRARELETQRLAELARQQAVVAAASTPAPQALNLPATPFSAGFAEHARRYRVGDQFQFRVIDTLTRAEKPFALQVTKVDEEGDRIEYNGGDYVSDLMGNITTNVRGTFSGPRQFYPSELFVGKKWQTMFKQHRPNGIVYTFKYDVRVVGRERITVPAGTFDTFKIEARGFNMQLGASLTRNIWVAPGVAADIAHETQVRLRNSMIEQYDRQELVALRQAGGAAAR